MSISRKRKHTFRPTVDGTLEERVVPATVGISVLRTPAALGQASVFNRLNNALTGRQLRNTVTQQIRTAINDARSAINAQFRQANSDGRLTLQERADLQARAQGTLNATALRLSSMASLLPGGNTQLVPGIQRSLLGDQRGSLSSRVESLLGSNQSTRSVVAFNRALNQVARNVATQRIGNANSFLRSPGLGFGSVDQSGVTIPISQFVGARLVDQLNNSLGMLSQTFVSQANSSLFPNGATTADPAAQQALSRQFLSALNLTASQLSSGLALFPGFASTLAPQLQSSLFATGADSTSLFNAIQGLPTTSDGFGTAATSAFSDTFRNLAPTLVSAFNVPPSALNLQAGTITDPELAFKLRTDNFTSPFTAPFSNLGNGFNNGFGSGFPGFGTTPTDFNPNFGTSFDTAISGFNTGFGLTLPTLSSPGTIGGGAGGGVVDTGSGIIGDGTGGTVPLG